MPNTELLHLPDALPPMFSILVKNPTTHRQSPNPETLDSSTWNISSRHHSFHSHPETWACLLAIAPPLIWFPHFPSNSSTSARFLKQKSDLVTTLFEDLYWPLPTPSYLSYTHSSSLVLRCMRQTSSHSGSPFPLSFVHAPTFLFYRSISWFRMLLLPLFYYWFLVVLFVCSFPSTFHFSAFFLFIEN